MLTTLSGVDLPSVNEHNSIATRTDKILTAILEELQWQRNRIIEQEREAKKMKEEEEEAKMDPRDAASHSSEKEPHPYPNLPASPYNSQPVHVQDTIIPTVNKPIFHVEPRTDTEEPIKLVPRRGRPPLNKELLKPKE